MARPPDPPRLRYREVTLTGELEGHTLRLRPTVRALTEFQRVSAMAADGGAANFVALFGALVPMIGGWSLVDPDGKPLPVSTESIEDLTVWEANQLLADISAAITAAQVGLPKAS
jgi:hypothetical protein